MEHVRPLGYLAAAAFVYLLARTVQAFVLRRPPFAVWPYIDVLFVTAALATVGNPNDGMSVLYFIPIASAVGSLSVPHVVALAGLTTAGYLSVIVYTQEPWTIPLLFRILSIGVVASLYGWVIRIVAGLERAAERAQYQTALAREIHDGIQHRLVTLGAHLELAQRLTPEAPVRASAILGEERETVRRAVDELRYLVRRLHQGPQTEGLAAALRMQVAALAERWPFALEIDVPPRLPRLSPTAEHALLRVIQESLTNAAKHARASRVQVRISADGSLVRCLVEDDGAGFDPESVSGSGLAGMEERILTAGGTLEIRSRPGEGTTVTAVLPATGVRS